MNNPSLEERVAALEKTVIQLIGTISSWEQPKDWRRTIGMFANDPIMEEIHEEGRRIRELDREKARKNADRASSKGKKKAQRVKA